MGMADVRLPEQPCQAAPAGLGANVVGPGYGVAGCCLQSLNLNNVSVCFQG